MTDDKDGRKRENGKEKIGKWEEQRKQKERMDKNEQIDIKGKK